MLVMIILGYFLMMKYNCIDFFSVPMFHELFVQGIIVAVIILCVCSFF